MHRLRVNAAPALVVAALTLGGPLVARAGLIPGGGNTRSDCYGEFDVMGVSFPSPAVINNKVVECTEGTACDQGPAGDDRCDFAVSLCINQTDTNLPDCTPPAQLDKVQVKGRLRVAIPALLVGPQCTAPLTFQVPLKIKANGTRKLGKVRGTLIAKAPAGTVPRKEQDKYTLKCLPPDSGPPLSQCSANPQGGPDQLVVTVLPAGNDLDNGWTGISHNFPLPSDSELTYCLSGCDGTTANPTCQASGPTGEGTDNGTTFGPPLPLVAGGVPVCVINRFQPGPVTATVDLVTGELNGITNLFSDVYVTDATRVCPRCENGTCDSGSRRDQGCSVDGTVFVQQSFATNKNFKLSKQCPPGGNPVSTLNIVLPTTTGTITTPGTGGTKPCREREAQGVPVKDNDCTGSGCGAPCQVGSNACTQMVANPSDPGQMICQDIKGGLSQVCCNDNPGLPCFPTQAGGAGIVRTGRPLPPTPAVPDPTYPKTAVGLVLASTFCEAATANANIDTVAGLPGPGAAIFNTQAVFSKNP